MEKIFIAIVMLYALYVGIYFLWTGTGKKRKKNIVGQGGSIHRETGRLKSDIVGKSKFELKDAKPIEAKSEPIEASPSKSGKETGNTGTFVPLDKAKPPAEVPQEELDEVFSDTPPDEDNEPMDIDYPLEYEPEEVNEDESEDEEEETEEVEGMAGAALASGVRFEDLGNMVRTVNRAEEATPEQRRKAGNTLLEIRETDMFEQVVSGKPDAKRIVTDLMTESLAAFHERKDREAGTGGSGKKAPENFNVRDFV